MSSTQEGYSVRELAELSGVSVRTLHHYDEIGLLVPKRAQNNYRSYGPAELGRLQQILLYRRLDMQLSHIKQLLDDKAFNAEEALLAHLETLERQQEQTQLLIKTINKTLAHMKGEETMSDADKFEGFKQQLINDNEEKYGTEIREKYGDDTIDASNAKLAGMTEEQWQHGQDLDAAFKAKIKEAMETGDPASKQAQEACELHKQWLSLFWSKDTFCPEAHLGLAQTYVCDQRFSEYLNAEEAQFFLDALEQLYLQ